MTRSNGYSMWLATALAGSMLVGVQAETYEIDASHAEVGFTIRHMGISNVRGKFKTFTGTIEYGGDVASLRATGSIETASVNTGNQKRDEHLRSPDFFDTDTYPEITFVTKSVDGDTLTGTLTMHGVSRDITMDVSVAGPIDDPWENQRIGVELSGSLKRHDWGIGGDGPTDRLIGKDVTIEINLEATKK